MTFLNTLTPAYVVLWMLVCWSPYQAFLGQAVSLIHYIFFLLLNKKILIVHQLDLQQASLEIEIHASENQVRVYNNNFQPSWISTPGWLSE